MLRATICATSESTTDRPAQSPGARAAVCNPGRRSGCRRAEIVSVDRLERLPHALPGDFQHAGEFRLLHPELSLKHNPTKLCRIPDIHNFSASISQSVPLVGRAELALWRCTYRS